MADKLCEHLQDETEKASIVYETDVASFADATCHAVFVDPRLEWSLLNAAI